MQAYQKGRYDSAKATLTRFLDENAELPEAGEASYIRGLCQLRLRRRTEAQRDFEAAIGKTARTELKARAQAALAVMAYDDGHWNRAIRYYDEAIGWLGDLEEYDEHLLRYGVSQQRMGKWDEAAQVFSQILHNYPKGSAAKMARYKLGWNRRYFTVQCHALTRADGATKEVARLRRMGLPAEQIQDTRGGRAMYLVHVGRHATYDEALKTLRRVERAGGVPDPTIVP